MIVRRRCEVLRLIQCGASGLTTSTRIAFQFLLNIPVLGRGVNYCIVSPRIKDLRSQLCFLSLPPSITVVSERDNLFNKNIIKKLQIRFNKITLNNIDLFPQKLFYIYCSIVFSVNPFRPSVPIWYRLAKSSILMEEGIIKKISYERRDYESVDDKILS